MLSEKKEECGIVGIYSKNRKNISYHIYRSLLALQHRGQDAAGIALTNGRVAFVHKGIGTVNEVFKHNDLLVEGYIGIGHTRYSTTGGYSQLDAQPSQVRDIAVAHNGHIANQDIVRRMLERFGYIFTSTVDSETIAYLLDSVLREGASIKYAIMNLMDTLDGAYSDVAIIGSALVVFRDPHAIRPLVWGENDDYICFASESVALDINGIEYKGTVKGGELVIVNEGGMHREMIKEAETRHCMFEYVYFSRPDSCINDRYVYEVREKLGEQLAREYPTNADVVVAVPDTSRTAASAFSSSLGIPLVEGLIKNRYIGRTFIMQTHDDRCSAVSLKLNVIRKLLENKRVVLIDDSIVRGTTLKEIISLIRKALPKEVHLRITCPPIRAPCFYGINIPTYKELIAHNRSIDELRKYFGADSIGYISMDGLKEVLGSDICTGCLDCNYPTRYVMELAKVDRC
ncbi:MAG: amidophosphoribosyltransferase [Candidatus Micrarchaeia archaeon]